MPTLKQLSVRHPCCDEKTIKKYDALYQGGKLFRDNIRLFLPQNKLEDPAQYLFRVREANYTSYVNSITNTYAAHLFSSPYAIRASVDGENKELDKYYAELKEDVDLCGTDLTSFFKSRFTEALIKGCSYWVIEFPDDGEPMPELLIDYQARGLDRAYFCPIPTENLINWECDKMGQYLWVVVHEESTTQATPFSEIYCTERFKIYDSENITIYELSYPVGKKPPAQTEVPLIGQYKHRFSQVPILGMCLPAGLWLLDKVADAQTEHFRLDTALGWSLRQSAYATLVLNLESTDDPPKPTPFGVAMGKEEKASYLEPPCTSMSFLQEQISKKRDEIYRIASQMALAVDNSSSAIGRSGDSKQADLVATEICLRGYASIVKESIENTFEFISNSRGEFDLKFSVEGMNQFSLIDATTLIANAQTAKALNIPSETFKKELFKYVAESLLPHDTKQEVKDTIREEIDSAKKEDFAPEVASQFGAQDSKFQFGKKESNKGEEPLKTSKKDE